AVLTNSGGALQPQTAASFPITTMLSGPVGGVLASRWIGAREGWSNLLTMDMGGTSCDVSGIVDGLPDERLDLIVDGHTISLPTYDIETIGAGGGSIAWIDSGGSLRVGPESAGSDPGPACYGRGGKLPTVTDANLVLGRYSADAPLGGSLVLSEVAARDAIVHEIAGPLGFGIEDAAAGILRIVTVMMMNAVRAISVERGRDVRDFTLIAYGGAGPTHAAEIARELGIPRVLVPPFPGCASAFGAVIAGARRDFIRTVGRAAAEVDVQLLTTMLSQFTEEALAALRADGYASELLAVERWLDLRYAGQAHELSIRAPSGDLTANSVAESFDGFHSLHRSLYGHAFDDAAVELVNVRIKAFGTPPEPPMWWDWESSANVLSDLASSRPVYFQATGETTDASVFVRNTLRTGDLIEGPSVIHQLDSTVLVPPEFVAEVRQSGSLVLHATSGSESGMASCDDRTSVGA